MKYGGIIIRFARRLLFNVIVHMITMMVIWEEIP